MAVEFENNSYSSNNYGGAPKKVGGVTGFIVKLGLAKTAKGANKVMLVIIVLALIWLGYAWLGGGSVGETTYVEDLTPGQRQALPQQVIDNLPSRN
ncbi:hypothetical protein CL654_00495 [bacterium]|nr:hypothetical protein [bacterium]|tara:strand:+ start:15957 stop:16244 length:288 start_codon:yes stop_codon:yes gene_type:complete